MVDAIVLAGGASEPGLSSDLPNKGFLQISGRSLVGYVVQAVREARGVGRVAVVGPPGPLRAVLPRDLTVVPDNGSIMENVTRAVQELGASALTLVAASDIPLLTSAVLAGATEVVGLGVMPGLLLRPELALDVDVGKPENLALIRTARQHQRDSCLVIRDSTMRWDPSSLESVVANHESRITNHRVCWR